MFVNMTLLLGLPWFPWPVYLRTLLIGSNAYIINSKSNIWYINCFSVAVKKYLDKISLRKRGVILAYDSRKMESPGTRKGIAAQAGSRKITFIHTPEAVCVRERGGRQG